MASLFIKDSETADRVRRMAKRLGSTQTDVVRRGLEALEKEFPPERASATERGLLSQLDEHRRLHPLPPKVAEADKAFFDRLWGEPD